MMVKEYVKYYIYGYLNSYYSDSGFIFDPSKESYKQYRIRFVLRYLGIKETSWNLSWLSPFLSISEAFFATILTFIRSIIVSLRLTFVKRQIPEGRLFFASFGLDSFRIKGLLASIRPQEVSTMRIPFIKNRYSENQIDIISVLSLNDVLDSLIASWKTIWTLYHKYRHRDPLFRSYSSFEYYLTCQFVSKTSSHNRFVFINTYDRWAFLMCNTRESTFIQHGKLMDYIKFIRIGTPYYAYYLSKKQGKVLEKVLFDNTPHEVKLMRPIEFTCNEILLNNGEKNVLIVCSNNFIDKEWEICRLIKGKCNIYIKPHPADKDNPEYKKMVDNYNCRIVPKTGYPKVDVVISYDSTLADQYEDVDVKVIRYDLLDRLDEIPELL